MQVHDFRNTSAVFHKGSEIKEVWNRGVLVWKKKISHKIASFNVNLHYVMDMSGSRASYVKQNRDSILAAIEELDNSKATLKFYAYGSGLGGLREEFVVQYMGKSIWPLIYTSQYFPEDYMENRFTHTKPEVLVYDSDLLDQIVPVKGEGVWEVEQKATRYITKLNHFCSSNNVDLIIRTEHSYRDFLQKKASSRIHFYDLDGDIFDDVEASLRKWGIN